MTPPSGRARVDVLHDRVDYLRAELTKAWSPATSWRRLEALQKYLESALTELRQIQATGERELRRRENRGEVA